MAPQLFAALPAAVSWSEFEQTVAPEDFEDGLAVQGGKDGGNGRWVV
jgi:hypothetical protein